MAEQFERVARPGSSPENLGISPPRGLNHSHLQLILTAIALLAGGAGAGITGYKWYTAEQHKTLNEGDQLQLEAEANRVFNEVSKNPASHPVLNEELNKLKDDLSYRPNSKIAINNYEWAAFALAVQKIATPQTEATLHIAQTQAARAQTTNSQQDTVKKRVETVESEQRTRKARADGDLAEEVVIPAIPMFHDSIMGTVSRKGEVLGVPGGTLILPQIPGRSSARKSGPPNPLADDASGLPNPYANAASGPPNPYADSAPGPPNPLKSTSSRVK